MRLVKVAQERLVAADPGLVRLRLAGIAVGGILLSMVVLLLLGRPIPTIMVASIAAMNAAFNINDKTTKDQAITLVLVMVCGAAALTVAAYGSTAPPLDSILFVLLIFVAVYAQRFAPRGTAMGALSFFMFFFAMFLAIRPAQLPEYILALAVGLAANAVMRFVVLRRRPEGELLRARRAFRARISAVVRAAAASLASGGSEWRITQLRKADTRLHEAVLMIEDTIGDQFDETGMQLLRRRLLAVELACQWLAITVRRAIEEADLPGEVRDDLVASMLRLDSLIESDVRELPVISETEEFSRMLVAGSRLKDRAEPGDEVRRAIAELALADVNAQRVAEKDYSAETELPEQHGESGEHQDVFTYDNRTRSAIQAMVGGGLAVLGGELISDARWYWAVLTVFVVFLNTSTAGATFVKGFRRVTGTLGGIFGGMLLALLVTGNTVATVVLILVCVFCLVYVARVSQLLMAFFITCMLGLLYSLLGTFSFEVLWLRVAETAIGAVAGLLAAIVVVPVRTRTVMVSDIDEALVDLCEFLDGAEALLSGRENVNVIELSRELDRQVEQVRRTIEPLTHPISLASRRDYGWYVLSALERIGFRARQIAARAEPGLLPADDRLAGVVERISRNIDVLRDTLDGDEKGKLIRNTGAPETREDDDATARSVLTSLGRMEAGIIALGRAFEVPVQDSTRSVQQNVRRRTTSAQAEGDRVTSTSQDSVRRSTQ
ncbi:FUSC family protein [Amycolatopsis endophytica]|uniref:Putative membrane protein YccC n=1 Tax=Amycolatopsis endophytica TaxID=860233 RepID=A0A853BBB2_9PSEU|nr:FUSC family protein [Amycolatopsis endophytica]NYI91961.1 putative membrane protein YccC [Amycolatopsis endophytica]